MNDNVGNTKIKSLWIFSRKFPKFKNCCSLEPLLSAIFQQNQEMKAA